MKQYLCIDLKTFYASVECVERGLDPFKVNLVVADKSRGKGALCLAISPRMKRAGVKNRCRLFEIPKYMQYMIAKPRMKLYMEYSANIYGIYLKYFSKDDIYVYSIDEAFFDITPYLNYYKKSALEIAKMILDDVYKTTGITATCGIGTNLYLAKIAMDIIAKHNDSNIGYLNEELYIEKLWNHKPITDFWQIGNGIARRLLKYGVDDMEGLANMSEELLYKEFGINARFLISHAWGKESVTIQQIKDYKPQHNSISNSQILFKDYNYQDALLILKEMVEINVLQLSGKHLSTDKIHLYIGYSKNVIKGTGGSRKISVRTNVYSILLEEFVKLYKQTTNKNYPIRQIGISFGNVVNEKFEYYDLFTDQQEIEKEKILQNALNEIKYKYGKNSVFKCMNLMENATQLQRNKLIGGHAE